MVPMINIEVEMKKEQERKEEKKKLINLKK
jgi:hypothetical protein